MLWKFWDKKPTLYESHFDLYQLLVQFDPEWFSLDWDSEQECIQDLVNTDAIYWEIVRQGRELLASESFPWREINSASHNCTRNSEEARKWFENLIDMVEAQLKSDKQS